MAVFISTRPAGAALTAPILTDSAPYFDFFSAAALALLDAVARLQPGVLNAPSHEQDSFSDGLLDCPHYSRPEVLAKLIARRLVQAAERATAWDASDRGTVADFAADLRTWLHTSGGVAYEYQAAFFADEQAALLGQLKDEQSGHAAAVQALRQPRLKQVIAYSTVAQLGYLFLYFPLSRKLGAGPALAGAALFAVGHPLDDLRARYAALPAVLAHLAGVRLTLRGADADAAKSAARAIGSSPTPCSTLVRSRCCCWR